MNSAAGAKRPAPESGGQYMPRKRPAAEDDDIMEEDFELEPPEDEFEDGADIEVGGESGGRRRRAAQGERSAALRSLSFRTT